MYQADMYAMFNHVWQGSTKLRGNNMIFSALSLLIFEASVPISCWRSLFECLSIYRQTWFTCLALGREPQTNGRENTIHLVQFTSRNVTVTISTREWCIRCVVTAGIHTNLYSFTQLHSAIDWGWWPVLHILHAQLLPTRLYYVQTL